MEEVKRAIVVGAPLEVTWHYLVEPSKLADWFADADRVEPGKSFRFDFGDGDFFAGEVVGIEEHREVRFHWRFMDIGPRFDIRWRIESTEQGTRVEVRDRGALTREEAAGLVEGWDDFLGRLAQAVATGTSARYRWSRTIGTAALLDTFDDEWPPQLSEPAWWRDGFAGAELSLAVREDERGLLLGFEEEAWEGASTEALVTRDVLEPGLYIGVIHRGWERLPPALCVDERRRYAGLWRQLLRDLELTGAAR